MHARLQAFVIAPDGELGAGLCGQLRRQPAQPDCFAQCGAELARGDPANDFRPRAARAAHNLQAFFRHHIARHGLEAHQALLYAVRSNALQRPLAKKVGFVQLHHCGQIRRDGVGGCLSVLAHNDVALLEPQNALRFHAKRRNAKLAARRHQSFPHRKRTAGWAVHFV